MEKRCYEVCENTEVEWVLGFLVVVISVVFIFTFGFSNRGARTRPWRRSAHKDNCR